MTNMSNSYYVCYLSDLSIMYEVFEIL